MGKAIYGLYGGVDPRTQAEMLALRTRIRELEAELADVRASAGPLAAADLDAPLVSAELDLELMTASQTALV